MFSWFNQYSESSSSKVVQNTLFIWEVSVKKHFAIFLYSKLRGQCMIGLWIGGINILQNFFAQISDSE